MMLQQVGRWQLLQQGVSCVCRKGWGGGCSRLLVGLSDSRLGEDASFWDVNFILVMRQQVGGWVPVCCCCCCVLLCVAAAGVAGTCCRRLMFSRLHMRLKDHDDDAAGGQAVYAVSAAGGWLHSGAGDCFWAYWTVGWRRMPAPEMLTSLPQWAMVFQQVGCVHVHPRVLQSDIMPMEF